MKSVWKWVLIFVGVFVLACLVSLPLFFMISNGRMPMMGYRLFSHPMMYGGYGFPGFRLVMFLARCLIPLGLLVLLVAGIVALVTYLRKPKSQQAGVAVPLQPEPVSAVEAVSEPIPAVESASEPPKEDLAQEPTHEEPVTDSQPEVVKTCKNCGSPLQEGWVNCPFCGEKI